VLWAALRIILLFSRSCSYDYNSCDSSSLVSDSLFHFFTSHHHHHHHHHMALQPNSGPGLSFWGFVTITFLQRWIVSPAPNPQPGGPGLNIYDPQRDRVAQIYPQALGTHFSRLLRHAWVTVGLFFNPGHHAGFSLLVSWFIMDDVLRHISCKPCGS
jgi:hypothetical protein